jgi:dephospho-CoA kinase
MGSALLPLAITGGAACGKSTVGRIARRLGASVEDSDVLARRAFDLEEVQSSLARLLQTEGPVDRGFLRSRMVEEPVLRREVNTLFHRRVWRMIEDSGAPIVEVPLLFEACLWPRFAAVLVVDCPQHVQLDRLKSRLGSEDAAKKLMWVQATRAARLALADYVLDGTSPEGDLELRVGAILARHGLG